MLDITIHNQNVDRILSVKQRRITIATYMKDMFGFFFIEYFSWNDVAWMQKIICRRSHELQWMKMHNFGCKWTKRLVPKFLIYNYTSWPLYRSLIITSMFRSSKLPTSPHTFSPWKNTSGTDSVIFPRTSEPTCKASELHLDLEGHCSFFHEIEKEERFLNFVATSLVLYGDCTSSTADVHSER